MDLNAIANLEAQKSLTRPKTKSRRLQSPSIDLQIRPVPISRDPPDIYSAADEESLQYDVSALKTLALNWIRREFSTCDTVEETFSRFASQ